MSFNPKKDGSKIWAYLHLSAISADTPYLRELYVAWLNSLKECFPCEICRKHLVGNLEEFPVEPYSNSRDRLFWHSWKLHDTVNGQLHKPQEQRLSYNQAREHYLNKTQDEVGNITWTYMHIMSANGTTSRKRELYLEWFNNLKDTFPCQPFREQFLKIMSAFPAEPYRNTNISLFRHSWKLHDAVNQQLEKPRNQCLDYDRAFAVYFPQHEAPGNADAQNGFERHLISAANPNTKQPNQTMQSSEANQPACQTCQTQPPESEKRTYQEFQQSKRRTYLAKNSAAN